MKRYILLLLLAVSYCSYSQPYQPILGDTTQWNYYVQFQAEGSMATAIFIAYGDTTINEVKYKKLFDSFKKNYNNDTALFGFIREDSTHTKLWIMYNNKENKIFDFNLKSNDTIIERKCGESFIYDKEIVVDNKRVIIARNHTDPYAMEGVGCLVAPYLIFGGAECDSYFLCAYRDGQLIYDNTNEWLNKCYLPTTIQGSVKESSINFFSISQKKNNKIHIGVKSEIENINTLQVFGVNGILIKSFYPESSEYLLDISQYSSGIYILVINEKFRFKIVK